jgi:soluble lytic murein transglycosylase
MIVRTRPGLALTFVVAAAYGAGAQTIQPQGGAIPVTPYGAPAPTYAPPATPVPYSALPSTLSSPASDAANVLSALAAARQGDASRVRAALYQAADPTAREIILWALIDGAPSRVSFAEADQGRRELAGWPRELRREEAAETLLPSGAMSPSQVIAWFGGAKPRTGPGALALAKALSATGHALDAAALIREAWRNRQFDQATQDAIIAAFGSNLTTDDYEARVDLLLYGGRNDLADDLLRFLPIDEQALARTRMAVRRGDPSADALVAALPPALQTSPGLTFDRMLRLRDQGQDDAARQLASGLATVIPDQAAAVKLWKHGALAVEALRSGQVASAYAVAAHSGLVNGPEAAEAEFMAGWLALTRMNDPRLADQHFAKLALAGESPLTQSRAYYWRGRAAEAQGDIVNAQLFFSQAATWPTAFYGQLAAARTGVKTLRIGSDPVITASARTAFEAQPAIKAMRYLAGIGAKDEFKIFAADLADIVPDAAQAAMLVDLTRAYGDPAAAMRAVRNAARRGLILPERGYPLVSAEYAGAEPALVLGVTRQESSFDPDARSGAGARGMMQLMPTTAAILARRMGLSYSGYELEDPQYNMRLGSDYLGQLVGQFSGSYVMAVAAYNAGPGRPNQWSLSCGDPRSSSTDPLNFIECIPFSETRDYVMRVLEAMQVYRARLHGGAAPLTLDYDLKRGAYGLTAGQPVGGQNSS